MQLRLFTGRGEALKDLDEVSLGTPEWAFGEGAATLTVPKRGSDYRSDPGMWQPRSILHKQFYLEMSNGLRNWAGPITSYSDDVENIVLGIKGCQWCLKRQVIRYPFQMNGESIEAVLERGFSQARPDGYRIRLAEITHAGPSLRGWVPPKSLYSFISDITERAGWEWTAAPRLIGGTLTIEVFAAPRLGRDYGRSAAFSGAVELLDDGLSRLIEAQAVVNEIVGLGKADKLGKSPVVSVRNMSAIAEPGGVRLSAVYPYPDITHPVALTRAATATLRRRGVLPVTVAARITDAKRGREAYELVDLGNSVVLDVLGWGEIPVRIVGYAWDPDTDDVTLALRHWSQMTDEQIEVDE